MTENTTEKITINLSVVDLGKIDLLVEEGFYSTRTDLIKTAIRNLLNTHETHIGQVVTRKSYALGFLSYGRKSLEATVANGEQLDIKVVGMAVIDSNVPPELAQAAIHLIEVKGVFRASEAVKEALGDKIK
ncbi:MAG: CopG family transcriptional regulator [Anaerolineae bacterium]|nr:CopG family transcriptional regulator [Anaerolineae bacterium]